MASVYEVRAAELLLNDVDRASYLKLMNGRRGEFTVTCEACGRTFQSYEKDTIDHIRSCERLRASVTER